MKVLNDTIKKLSGKHSKPEKPVKDKAGRNPGGATAKENGPVSPNPPDILLTAEDLDIECGTPT